MSFRIGKAFLCVSLSLTRGIILWGESSPLFILQTQFIHGPKEKEERAGLFPK